MSNTNEKIDIVEILKAVSTNNEISCARVFEIVNKYSFFPDLAGLAMNQHQMKITCCQLGLFGYPEGKNITPCETVSEMLEDKIYDSIEEDKLPCAAAWNIANEMNIKKMDVTSACDKLSVKIGKCQLGAFNHKKQ